MSLSSTLWREREAYAGDLLNHFLVGTGAPRDFGVDSGLSQDLVAHANFIARGA